MLVHKVTFLQNPKIKNNVGLSSVHMIAQMIPKNPPYPKKIENKKADNIPDKKNTQKCRIANKTRINFMIFFLIFMENFNKSMLYMGFQYGL